MDQMEEENEGNHIEQAKRIMDSIMEKYQISIPNSNFEKTTNNSSSGASMLSFSSQASITSQEQSEEQVSYQQSNTTDKVMTRCKYIPMYLELANNRSQFFIFGGYCLDFRFKREEEEYSLMKINRQISHLQYFKKEKVLLLHFDEAPPSIRDLNPLIRRAQSIPDYQYYILSLAMIEYAKQIQTILSIQQEKANSLKSSIELYEQNYKKFEKWALEKVLKIDQHLMFSFSIYKFNTQTMENETKISGYSQGLMAVRGINLEDPFQYTRKETYHFLDGESNLNILVNQLSGRVRNKCYRDKCPYSFPTKMLTFDSLKIDVSQRCIEYSNRDETYPFVHEQFSEGLNDREFFIQIAFFDVSPQSLLQLIQIRNERSIDDYIQFEDFSYSLESQVFLEKYYQDKLNKLQNNSTTYCSV